MSSAGGYGSGAIVNDGTINVEATSGEMIIDPAAFTNAGTIDVAAGNTLGIQSGTFTNAAGGTITAASGSSLALGNASATETVTNAGAIVAQGATVTLYWDGPTSETGTLSVTQSTVELYGTFTTAMLAVFAGQGDTIEVYGTLDNTGTTLAVGTGSALGTLTLEGGGVIVSGTIQDAGSGADHPGGYAARRDL